MSTGKKPSRKSDPPSSSGGLTPVKTETPETVAVQRIGRPTYLDQAMVDTICEHIEQGKSLRSFCEQEGTPALSTVTKWLRENRAFSAQYADARARGMDVHAEEILAIADEGRNDTYTDEDGNTHTDYDVIARSKLRIDARKWLMSKLAPKKYGDRVEVEQSGSLTHTIKFTRG